LESLLGLALIGPKELKSQSKGDMFSLFLGASKVWKTPCWPLKYSAMWTWVQQSGELLNSDGKVLAKGYSGMGIAKNDPSAQQVPDMGPIPQGKYTVYPPVDSQSHGPYAMHLMPETDNEMFGRAGFMIHGDSLEHPGFASDGCIILPRAAREAIWQSDDHDLLVIGKLVEQGDEGAASD
jgi:hypothetical protein